MSDTNIASGHALQAPNGPAKKRGGGLDQKFPWREVVHVDAELHGAIELAANVEKERAAVVMRRWLRRSAMAEGYYKPAAS